MQHTQAAWTNHDAEYNNTLSMTRRGAHYRIVKVFFAGSANKKEKKKISFCSRFLAQPIFGLEDTTGIEIH